MSTDKWYAHPDRPCKNRTAEWFFEGVDRNHVAAAVEDRKRECLTCPVLEQCREDVRNRDKTTSAFGVQAAMSQREQVRYIQRSRIRRSNRVPVG